MEVQDPNTPIPTITKPRTSDITSYKSKKFGSNPNNKSLELSSLRSAI